MTLRFRWREKGLKEIYYFTKPFHTKPKPGHLPIRSIWSLNSYKTIGMFLFTNVQHRGRYYLKSTSCHFIKVFIDTDASLMNPEAVLSVRGITDNVNQKFIFRIDTSYQEERRALLYEKRKLGQTALS